MTPEAEKLRQNLIDAYEKDLGTGFKLPDSGDNNVIKDFATRIEEVTGGGKPYYLSLYSFLSGNLKNSPQNKYITLYQKYIDIINSQKSSPSTFVPTHVSADVKPFLNAISALITARDYISVPDIYSKGIIIAKEKEDIYGETLLKIWYSKVLEFTDPPQAEMLIRESLNVLNFNDLSAFELELKERLCHVQLRQNDTISARISANELLDLAHKEQNRLYIAKAYFLFSRINFLKGHINTSLHFANSCLKEGKSWVGENTNPVDAACILAKGYYAKSQVYIASGESVLARLNLRNAIQEYRKQGTEDSVLADSLLSLAELDWYLKVNTLPTLTAYLNDALRIYGIYTAWDYYLRCVPLLLEIALVQDNLKFARYILDTVNTTLPINQSFEYKGILLSITSGYYLRTTEYAKAEETLTQLHTLANDRRLHHLLIPYYSGMSVLEAVKGNSDSQKEYLILAAKVLEKQIHLNDPPKSELRYLYAELLRLSSHSIPEAIDNYEKAAQEYNVKGLNEPYALLLVKAGKGYCERGNSDKAKETLLLAYGASKNLVSPETAIAVREACAVYFFRTQEFKIAKMYFDEAISLSRKNVIKLSETLNRLSYLFTIKESLDHPIYKAFDDTSTILHLYEVLNNIGEEAERRKFIRFWFYTNFPKLYKSVYHSHGLKGAILTDDVHTVLLVSGKLYWLFDFFFVYSNDPPNDSILVDSFAVLNHSDGKSFNKLEGIGHVAGTLYPNQYAVIENDTGFLINGICEHLPTIAYDCVGNKVISPTVCVVPTMYGKEIKKNYFGIHSWLDAGCIPIYINEDCPYPALRTIPINMLYDYEPDSNTLKEAKRLINSLWNIPETHIQASLSTFKLDWDSLIEGLEYETIPAHISIVEVDLGLRKQITPVLTLTQSVALT